jgi:hypothetical protein
VIKKPDSKSLKSCEIRIPSNSYAAFRSFLWARVSAWPSAEFALWWLIVGIRPITTTVVVGDLPMATPPGNLRQSGGGFLPPVNVDARQSS